MPITRVPSMAIKHVVLERGGTDQIVRLTFANGISLRAVRPVTIRVQQTDDGLVCALEIEAVDDVFVRVAFRATARLDELDGLAPGELDAVPVVR
jgi:hypothetical protein